MRHVSRIVLVIQFFASSLPCPSEAGKAEPYPSIPEGLARVQKVYPGSTGSVVYLVRDLHAHGQAQQREVSALRWLHRKTGLKRIFMEGAQGPLNTVWVGALGFQPDMLKVFLDEALRQGELTAGEYLAVSDPAVWTVTGVDDAALFRENVRSFLSLHEARTNLAQIFKTIERRIRRAYDQHAPVQLRQFDRSRREFRAGKLALKQYCSVLDQIAGNLGIPSGSASGISGIRRLSRIEHLLPSPREQEELFGRLEQRIQKLPRDQMKPWIEKVLAFRLGRIPASGFLREASSLLEARDRRRLKIWIEASSVQELLNTADLDRDIRKMERRIEERLIWSAGLDALRRTAQDASLLRRSCMLELDHTEWESLDTRKIAQIVTQISSWKDQVLIANEEAAIIADHLETARNFYETATARENRMAKNVIRRMKKEDLTQAAIISGGFHSDALADRLSRAGHTVLVLVPSVSSAGDPSQYARSMTARPSYLESLLGHADKSFFERPARAYPGYSGPAALMPPLRLAMAHESLRSAFEDKGLFLSFLHFMYVEAPGVAHLRETGQFKTEFAQSFRNRLREEGFRLRLSRDERNAIDRQMLSRLDAFFNSLRVRAVDRRGETLEIQAQFDGRPFTAILAPPASGPARRSRDEPAAGGRLSQNIAWSLNPSGMRDPHFEEVKVILESTDVPVKELEGDLKDRIWALEPVSIQDLKKSSPEVFNRPPAKPSRVLPPVILKDFHEEGLTLRVLSGTDVLAAASRTPGTYYVDAWTGVAPASSSDVAASYERWLKSKTFLLGSFDSVLKSKFEGLMQVLDRIRLAKPSSDEELFAILRETVLKGLDTSVQDIMIDSLRRVSLQTPRKDFEKKLASYGNVKASARTAREVLRFERADGAFHWESLSNLMFSHSFILNTIAWDLAGPSLLEPLALHHLEKSDVMTAEEALRVLGGLRVQSGRIVQILAQTREFRLAEAAVDALAKIGDDALDAMERTWNPQDAETVRRFSRALSRIRTPRAAALLVRLYLDLDPELRKVCEDYLKDRDLGEVLGPAAWAAYRDTLTPDQKQVLMQLLKDNASLDAIGPLLYLAASDDTALAVQASSALLERSRPAPFLEGTGPAQWAPVTRFLDQNAGLVRLGFALTALDPQNEQEYAFWQTALLEMGRAGSIEPFLELIVSNDERRALAAAIFLDRLQLRAPKQYERVLPGVRLQDLRRLLKGYPMGYEDLADIRAFINNRGKKDFYRQVERLSKLRGYFQSDEAFRSFTQSVGLGTLLGVEDFEQHVEIKIDEELSLEVHPGVVQTLRDSMGAEVQKRQIALNSVRMAPVSEEDTLQLRDKAMTFRKFNEANFQLIRYFQEGDWSPDGFKASKNRVFQFFEDMLKEYETLFPQDPQIFQIRRKAAEIRDASGSKAQLMDLGAAQNLDEILTLHGLLRYLHGKGIEQMFDVINVRVKDTGRASIVSTYLVDPSGRILEQVHHPVILINRRLEDERRGYPQPLRFFMRNMLHTIDPALQSPYIQAMIDENEIFCYFGMGRHTAELFANFTHPDRGGMMQLRWNEGAVSAGEGWEDAGEYVAPLRMYIIERILENLGVKPSSDAWQIRARYDKEAGARTISDIMRVAGSTLRASASFKDVDVALGQAASKNKNIQGYLEELSQFIIRMGKVEFYKAARRGLAVAGKVSAMERHEQEIRSVLNRILESLNLGPIPEIESKPFGQVAVNRYFNKRIEEGLRAGVLQMDEEGRVRPDPTWKEIRQVPEMARQLSNEDSLDRLLETAAVVRSIAPVLKFKAIGSVNGYPVQRAHMEILGKVLTFVVLRNHQGEILAAFTATGIELYSRKSGGKIKDNLIRRTDSLVRILRKSGFPVSMETYKIDPAEREHTLSEIRRIESHPVAVRGKLFPGNQVPGIGISTGIAVGQVKLHQDGLDPQDLADRIWIVPFALPDHASIIRKSLATVMTGGSPLTHAGMLVREARRPGVIVEGKWIHRGGRPQEIQVTFETYDPLYETEGNFDIARRQNITSHVAALQDGDVVMVNGDGQLYLFHPSHQEAAREILNLTRSIRTGDGAAPLEALAGLLKSVEADDLVQLAVFDLFQNNPALSVTGKKDLLGRLLASLPERTADFVRSYLKATLENRRQQAGLELHDIKTRIPDVRQPFEIEYLLSKALDVVEDYQTMQMIAGASASVFRRSLAEILDLAAQRMRELRDTVFTDFAATPLIGLDFNWIVQSKRLERARKLGAISPEVYQDIQTWMARWLDAERQKFRGKLVHRLGHDSPKSMSLMVDLVGAKAAKLAEISGLVPVPSGFSVDVETYHQFLEENGLIEPIREVMQAGDPESQKAAQIQALIRNAPLSPRLSGQVLNEYRRMGSPEVAVRSSSTAEDLDKASFAGQMETILNVRGEEALLKAVRRAWASLWTQRAIEYRRDYGLPPEVGQAVFVQTMIDAQVSGVMSTINTLTNDWRELVINSGWGLGIGPIEGNTNADQFILDMKTGRVRSMVIREKTRQYTSTSKGKAVPVSPEKVQTPTLTSEQLQTLHGYAAVVENYYGVPLDMEFAIDPAGKVHMLQVRPITTVNIRDDVRLEDRALQSLYRKPLELFALNLWSEYLARIEGAPVERSLELLRNIILAQPYSAPDYQGRTYIVMKVLENWMAQFEPESKILPHLRNLLSFISGSPYQAWNAERLRTARPGDAAPIEPYLDYLMGERQDLLLKAPLLPAPHDLSETPREALRVVERAA